MTNRIFTRQLAFTLIELLVIIVIVALALVMIPTGIRRAKEEALRKNCVQNLKQSWFGVSPVGL